MKRILLVAAALFMSSAMAEGMGRDLLVRIAPNQQKSTMVTLQAKMPAGTKVEDLGINGWTHVKMPATADAAFTATRILSMPGVLRIEKNAKLGLLENFKVRDAKVRAEILRRINAGGFPGMESPAPDNPEIPLNGSGGSGADPLFNKQWGMNQMGVTTAWGTTKGTPEIIVGVIDTGVDYTHEDLVDNMWHNPGEIPNDGIDNDGNGYIDDIVGWDFASNDNKPFDLTASMIDMVLSGGNPGHGTHCAGNVAARGDNGKGIAGVAPNVKIMALRFITEKGQGTTADAVKAIKYGVDNGAKVLSNSWGSTGDDGGAESQALQDAIRYSEAHNVLFVAAAGNGDEQGVGYDNDSSAKPAFPATYNFDSIVSVAAIDVNGALGTFSNWGARTVDIAAPGVAVFSTVTSSEKYSDTVIDIAGIITAHWDGTSMATPHVAGAAALYLSAHPGADFRQIKNALMMSAKQTPVLAGKVVSGGQLDVHNLMAY
jgi:subtilisin family serine protease